MNLMLLALAVNFEPTRIGLLPLLLSRHRPLLQLATFLGGSLTMSLSSGLLLLFVLERVPLRVTHFSSYWTQIAIGAIALTTALVIVLHWLWSRRRHVSPLETFDEASQHALLRGMTKLRSFLSSRLRKGRSPWVAALTGLGVGLPSVDYLAVLEQQAIVLVMFVLTGSLVIMVPMLGLWMAPTKALKVIGRFRSWIQSRSLIEYAALLAILGCLLIMLNHE
jgi:hypothetical protein